ncbi:MAG: SAM-dependent methyltransferase [Acidimicrobiales bacterium]
MRDPAAFEDLYATDPDPWDFRTSAYEQGRYDAVMSALRRPRYRRAFEPACSVGELTLRLARRCDRIDAVELSPTAAAQAQQRCRALDHVHIEVGSVMDHDGQGYDLVVFSELGYYFEAEDLALLVDRLVNTIEPGGELVACHWLGTSPDHRLHGDEVHDVLATRPGLEAIGGRRHEGFRIESWTRIAATP